MDKVVAVGIALHSASQGCNDLQRDPRDQAAPEAQSETLCIELGGSEPLPCQRMKAYPMVRAHLPRMAAAPF